jgi:hypothetical protein
MGRGTQQERLAAQDFLIPAGCDAVGRGSKSSHAFCMDVRLNILSLLLANLS